MSNKTIDKPIEYSAATGMLIPVVEELLIDGLLSKEDWAKIIVKLTNEMDSPPDSLTRLKERLKEKYNL